MSIIYGDVMLDEWRIGKVDPISPEAIQNY